MAREFQGGVQSRPAAADDDDVKEVLRPLCLLGHTDTFRGCGTALPHGHREPDRIRGEMDQSPTDCTVAGNPISRKILAMRMASLRTGWTRPTTRKARPVQTTLARYPFVRTSRART